MMAMGPIVRRPSPGRPRSPCVYKNAPRVDSQINFSPETGSGPTSGHRARQYTRVRRTGVWLSAIAAFAILGGLGLVGVGMLRGGDNSTASAFPLAGSFK